MSKEDIPSIKGKDLISENERIKIFLCIISLAWCYALFVATIVTLTIMGLIPVDWINYITPH